MINYNIWNGFRDLLSYALALKLDLQNNAPFLCDMGKTRRKKQHLQNHLSASEPQFGNRSKTCSEM